MKDVTVKPETSQSETDLLCSSRADSVMSAMMAFNAKVSEPGLHPSTYMRDDWLKKAASTEQS